MKLAIVEIEEENGFLLCPSCGTSCLHLRGVDGPRNESLQIKFDCENCSAGLLLRLDQYKGHTEVIWETELFSVDVDKIFTPDGSLWDSKLEQMAIEKQASAWRLPVEETKKLLEALFDMDFKLKEVFYVESAKILNAEHS